MRQAVEEAAVILFSCIESFNSVAFANISLNFVAFASVSFNFAAFAGVSFNLDFNPSGFAGSGKDHGKVSNCSLNFS